MSSNVHAVDFNPGSNRILNLMLRHRESVDGWHCDYPKGDKTYQLEFRQVQL